MPKKFTFSTRALAVGDPSVGVRRQRESPVRRHASVPEQPRERLWRGVYVLDEGAESGHLTFKGDVIDLPDFGSICRRGQAPRIKAGTLTGCAAEHAQAELAAAAPPNSWPTPSPPSTGSAASLGRNADPVDGIVREAADPGRRESTMSAQPIHSHAEPDRAPRHWRSASGPCPGPLWPGWKVVAA
ncbi:hypothetical protein [Streptomyces rhizosphaericus]|uniref:Uncharacterized protein n=1 Tax=Streptomyces rhizosphaericus TaxID=114699 RepID=A0A6G4ATD4_9ACTN|nr:hypothetical protein [Streptomyces rhizosphaericus]NEW76522.1 hypothetical protein [Streptomyces rhizosphaericus]